jgi:Ca-activated chloride channel family protein
MKKIISLLLITLSLSIIFTGCGAGGATGAPSGGDNVKPSSTTTHSAGIMSPDASGDIETDESLAPSEPIPDEDYGKFIENEFINVLEQAQSTFSADVDTASYAYFRKLVNQGYNMTTLKSLLRGQMRTEEMINYFRYSYNTPASEGELFGVNTEIASCPWNENAKLLVIGLQSDKIETASSNNLVFLIDVSGSMASEDKLELIKRSFSYLVQNLGGDDRVSIVTYSGKEEVVLEGCEGSKHAEIMTAINSLSASGSTNGEAGINKAYQIAEANYIEGGNNRIILASDGDLNVGISSPKELEKLISEKKDEGVYLSVLGFGTGNYMDDTMETLADKGNGIYYYIDGESEAERVFGEDLFSTLYTIAKDVKLQITFDPQYVEQYRLVGYENRLLHSEDFEDDSKDAGELGSGHSVTVCYELILTEEARRNDEAWMTLAVRYKAPDALTSTLNEYAIGGESYTEAPSEDFRLICALIETSLIFRDSKFIGDITLENVLSDLNALTFNGAEDAARRLEFKGLIEKLISLD